MHADPDLTPPLGDPTATAAPTGSRWPALVTLVLTVVCCLVPGTALLHPVLALIALFWGWQRGSLSVWIIVMMICGCLLGNDFVPVHNATGLPVEALQVPSQIFIRMVKTVVAPLLFATLVIGINSHGDMKTVGRLGAKSLIYFEVVTTIALFVGLLAINLSQAGLGIDPSLASADKMPSVAPKSGIEIILHTFPENFAKSVAEGDVLQVVVFSILFGVALGLVNPARRKPLLDVIEGLAETMFKFTALVMKLAPLAVGSAMAFTVARMGLAVLGPLAKLLLTLAAALTVFVVCVLLPIVLLSGLPLVPFLRAISEPVSIAFATSTSEAALPRAMERLEQLGVPRHVVSFVMPLGYSFNLDGTTLYLALAGVFVSQAAGKPMPLTTQIIMLLSLMLSSKGVAGVPRASLVILLGTVSAFQLPEWPVLVILGIDGLMDMMRTSVNVTGNCLAAAVVARWEGVFVPNYASSFYDGHRPAEVAAAEIGA